MLKTDKKEDTGRILLFQGFLFALVAYWAGMWFDLEDRKLFLVAVLAGGIYLLLRIKQGSRKRDDRIVVDERRVVGRTESDSEGDLLGVGVSINQLFAVEKELSSDEIRDWLDQFILSQQTGEKGSFD